MLQLIFERLKLSDLLRVIESDDALLEPAIWAFRHKHSHNLIGINGPGFPFGAMFNISIRMHPGVIELQNFETTLKVLQLFGGSIQRLHIIYKEMQRFEMADINELILMNCADTLIHFGMTFRTNNMNSEVISTKFLNVESVTLSEGDFNGDFPFDLNEKFPKMRTLELNRLVNNTDKLIDRHFPRLEHLKVYFPYDGGLNESQIERVLQKNPRINSVTAGKPSPGFLNILSNNLRFKNLHLHDLHWDFFTADGPVVHFETVKKLSMQMLFHIIPTLVNIPLSFGELIEIKLTWRCSELSSQWVQFVEGNENLEKLDIEFDRGDCTEYAHLADLKLPKLREVQLKGIDLDNDEMDDFFDKIKQWINVKTIRFVDIPKDEIDLLRDKIILEWKMNIFASDHSEDLVSVVISKTQLR